jgi:hypothetical protein
VTLHQTFKKFFRRLATEVSEANDIPYCISLSYWQKRLSTALQKLNATQIKISQKLGLLRYGVFGLNDTTIDNGRLTSLDIIV